MVGLLPVVLVENVMEIVCLQVLACISCQNFNFSLQLVLCNVATIKSLLMHHSHIDFRLSDLWAHSESVCDRILGSWTNSSEQIFMLSTPKCSTENLITVSPAASGFQSLDVIESEEYANQNTMYTFGTFLGEVSL